MEEKTMKKALSILLAAGMLIAATTGMAVATENETNPWRELPYYLSITGTVVSVEELVDRSRIIIEDEHGNPAHLYVNENTVFPFADKAKAGDTVTGFYLANAPMPLIWPPRYNIAVLAAGVPDDINVKVDRFYDWEGSDEGYLLAQGGAFAFKVDENTEIVLTNGDDFSDGDYVGRRIAVIYDVSTRSIPELTTAKKIIVLYEDIMALPDSDPVSDLDYVIDATGWPILVDGALVDAPAAYQTDNVVIMVPLRAIAEKLGWEVKWHGATKTVTLGDEFSLTIGDPNYKAGGVVVKKTDGTIPPVPVLRNGVTYVPLVWFFRDVMDLPNAYAFEGQIEIHSEGERME